MTTAAAIDRPKGSTVAESPRWTAASARLGIGARGVIYLAFAYLAFDIARHGNAPVQADSTGALAEVGRRSGGTIFLIVLAVGLACYALWRLIDAFVSDEGALRRLGSLGIAVIYVGLLMRALQLAAGHPTSGGTSANPAPTVVALMRHTGGTAIVGICGVVLIASGVGVLLWGLFHDYFKTMAVERVRRPWQRMIQILGAGGNGARGFLLALVGGYLIATATSADPAKAKGVDQALEALVHHPYGAVVIDIVALGLLCFGAFSFFDAWLRRV